MKNLVVPLIISAWASVAAPAVAHATCMEQCKAELMGSQCAALTTAVQGEPLWFWLDCQTCCSPPGGPAQCSVLDPYSLTYKVLKSDGTPAAGFMSPSAVGCPGKKGVPLVFIGEGGAPLPVGDYQLLQDSTILLTFTVTAKPVGPDAGGDIAADTAGDTAGDAAVAQDAGPAPDTADAASADLSVADAAANSPASASSSDSCRASPAQPSALPWALALLAGAGLLRGRRRRC